MASSKNSFTIYGSIYNIGYVKANSTELTVRFYDNSSLLLQESIIPIGVIGPLANSPEPYYYLRSNISCPSADQVINIQVTLS